MTRFSAAVLFPRTRTRQAWQPRSFRAEVFKISPAADAAAFAQRVRKRLGLTQLEFTRYIDHGFSFPLRYFEVHQLEPDWPKFLEDFQRHWPTDAEHTYVDFVRDGLAGNGAARTGNTRWRRMTEQRARRLTHRRASLA